MKEVKRTERGWAGHFCCASDCMFRRNTLLEYGDKKWIVSTVGCQAPYYKKGEIISIGDRRWYETMAFEAINTDGYLDADITKEIKFISDWGIWGETWANVLEKYNNLPDLAANDMHEKVVEELMEKIKGDKMKYRLVKEDKLRRLIESDMLCNELFAYGVDNWTGYDDVKFPDIDDIEKELNKYNIAEVEE
jgi:hypothetical protein